jgi:hypothetical protein
VKHYFLFLTVVDPQTLAVRNVMVGWNEKDWALFSQSVALTCIETQTTDSDTAAWGTDSRSVSRLFLSPSKNLKKRLSTKVYGTDQLFILKDFLNLYIQAQDMSANDAGISLTATMVASGVAIQPTSPNAGFDALSVASDTYPAALFQQPNFPAPFPYWPIWGTGTGGFSFDTLSVQMTTMSPDFAISNLMIAYLDNTAFQ